MPFIKLYNRIFGVHSVGAYDSWFSKLGRIFSENFPAKQLFNLFTIATGGWTPDQYDPRYFNLMYSEFPSEMSWKTLYHLAQLVDAKGRFQMYDYGSKKNIAMYGSKKPPAYPVQKIKTPNFFLYAKQDSVVVRKDIDSLFKDLSKEAIYGRYEVEDFCHSCYLYGKDMENMIYSQIYKVLDSQ